MVPVPRGRSGSFNLLDVCCEVGRTRNVFSAARRTSFRADVGHPAVAPSHKILFASDEDSLDELRMRADDDRPGSTAVAVRVRLEKMRRGVVQDLAPRSDLRSTAAMKIAPREAPVPT